MFAGLGYNLFKQVQRQENDPDYEFSFSELLGDLAKGGTMGLLGGGLIDALEGPEGEAEGATTSRSAYLRFVLKRQDSGNFRSDYLYQQKGRELKGLLVEKFGDRIYPPETSGSIRKGTGVGEAADMDIIVPFRKTEGGPGLVYEEVYAFFEGLQDEDDFIRHVRRQRKSIGVGLELEGADLWFDIVPGIEVNDFLQDKELKLFVAALYYREEPDEISTNVHKQERYLIGNEKVREVIRLLKVMRDTHRIDVSSYFIQCASEVAFHKLESQLPRTLFDRLMMVLKYLGKVIPDLRLVDPGNTSNIVSEELNPRGRNSLQEFILEAINDIDEDSRNLAYYFPAE